MGLAPFPMEERIGNNEESGTKEKGKIAIGDRNQIIFSRMEPNKEITQQAVDNRQKPTMYVAIVRG